MTGNVPPIPGDSKPAPAVPAEQTASEPRWFCKPPIDIYETAEGLALKADLPGVTVENLELQVQDNKLTLLGRVASAVPAQARLIYQEYRVGDFLRSFILSDDVDHERISAKLSDGVLELSLPKSAQPTPRRIQIETD